MNTIQPVLTFLEGTDKAKRQHQANLELLYDKNQTVSRIRREFEDCESFNFARYMRLHHIPEEPGFAFLAQMALHKRTTLPTMIGILRHFFEPEPNASQMAADFILQAVTADLADWNPALRLLIVKFTISEDVQRDLDRYQYPLPMVVPPKQVRDNTETGFLLRKGSIILRRNHHEDDVCLDHINRVNRIRFCINLDTARMVRNQWRNLDKPKSGESMDDYQKRVKAFDKYDRTAKEVMAQLLAYGNEFYLTHSYDKRGRIYCQGYHVNYQGAPWNKAVIELADKEYID